MIQPISSLRLSKMIFWRTRSTTLGFICQVGVVLIVTCTGCAMPKAIGVGEDIGDGRLPQAQQDLRSADPQTADRSSMSIAQTGFQQPAVETPVTPAIQASQDETYPAQDYGLNGQVPYPGYPPYRGFTPGLGFRPAVIPAPQPGSSSYVQNGIPQPAFQNENSLPPEPPNDDVFAGLEEMNSAQQNQPETSAGPVVQLGDQAPMAPESNSRGYLQRGPGLSGLRFNPPGPTATEFAFELKRQNDALSDYANRLKLDLDNRIEELAETNQKLSESQNDLASANQKIQELNDQIANLKAAAKVAKQENAEMQKQHKEELIRIQWKLETAVMDTISRAKTK